MTGVWRRYLAAILTGALGIAISAGAFSLVSPGSLARVRSAWAADETIKVGGTGGAIRVLQILAAGFERATPGVRVVVVTGLGSRGGRRAVEAGAIDVAVSADVLTEAEQASLVARELGRTPFVFVVPPQNPTTTVTLSEVANFFLARTPAWPDGVRVRPILRPASDSDTVLLKAMSPAMDQAVREAHARPGMRVAPGDQESADAVETVPGAIGTSSLALVTAERRPLKVLALGGVRPTPSAIRDGTYPYFKTFHLVTRRPAPSPPAQRFLDFMTGARGRELLATLGVLVP